MVRIDDAVDDGFADLRERNITYDHLQSLGMIKFSFSQFFLNFCSGWQ